MRIRICDIPPEGRELDFALDKEQINSRILLAWQAQDETSVAQPNYEFSKDPQVHLHLDLDGSTVVIKGKVLGDYVTLCSRCAEETKQHLEIPLDLILKPKSERVPDEEQEEDLSFGTYEKQEIHCEIFSEDFLVLGLPFSVLCSENCKGLCSHCGINLNLGSCKCQDEKPGDPRLSVLRQIKIQ